MSSRKLYFDAKGLSLFNYKFEIRDEAGNLCYKAATVTESMIRYNAKLYDAYDNEIIKVSQQSKMTLASMNFDLLNSAGQVVCEAIQKVKFVTFTYDLKPLDINIAGNFVKMTFDFTRNGHPVAHVRKKIMAWGDCYELEIFDPSLEVIFLASVLMIQLVIAAQRNRRR